MDKQTRYCGIVKQAICSSRYFVYGNNAPDVETLFITDDSQTMSNVILGPDAVPASENTSLHTRWLDVTVSSLEEGDPLRLTFYFVLTLRNGGAKHSSRSVIVTDDGLQERLRLRPGDSIRVCLETEWAAGDIPTILKDFCIA